MARITVTNENNIEHSTANIKKNYEIINQTGQLI